MSLAQMFSSVPLVGFLNRIKHRHSYGSWCSARHCIVSLSDGEESREEEAESFEDVSSIRNLSSKTVLGLRAVRFGCLGMDAAVSDAARLRAREDRRAGASRT